MNYAPVLIPTLNRHVHLKRCIDSLSKCIHADKTDLYVALDYPLIDEHWDGYQHIREYLPTVRVFRSVNIIERDRNYGAVENDEDARGVIFAKHDRLIYSEDDNEFSPGFLIYMNMCLDVYETRRDIHSVCGYCFPVKIPKSYKHDIWIWPGFNAWGAGYWRDKHILPDNSFEEVVSYVRDKELQNQVKQVGEHVHRNLLSIYKSEHVTGDTVSSLYIVKNNLYSVFPVISRVRNWGHDGTGEHCGKSGAQLFHKQEIYQKVDEPSVPYDIQPDPKMFKIMRKYGKGSLKFQIKKIVLPMLKHMKLHGK